MFSSTRPKKLPDEPIGLSKTFVAAALTLSVTLADQGRDEPAQLLAALNHMNTSLATVVKDVRQSSEGIALGSDEIAGGNADLSRRTVATTQPARLGT